MSAYIYDDRVCALGEGALWHPLRNQLFWFDILGHKLLTRENGKAKSWQFDEHVSAAGWVDETTLLIASETGLFRFDIANGDSELLHSLEADNTVTRSNDGRADPYGGFWIGTMGKNAESGAGAIYRLHKGEIRKIVGDVSITNAICFAPDKSVAYYTDTATKRIMKVALDQTDGWPVGDAEVFVDLTDEGLNPDGAVVDAAGNLWSAQWGAHRVACYDPRGTFVREIRLGAEQISCPAFGGDGLSTLFATSAAVGLEGDDEGKTFAIDLPDVRGQAEHAVILD